MSNKYTVLDFLNNSVDNENGEKLEVPRGIEIPMIQRDYAQGRKDVKTTYIREKFLKDIHLAMKDGEPLNLDFVYGYTENSSFIPLDGQQRLTTLYLIYWYLAFKDECLTKYDFTKFNYSTRQSSKEFLKNLNTNENFNPLFTSWNRGEQILSKIIQNQPWFSSIWKYDPTVQGLLSTLEDVENMFSDIQFEEVYINKPVTFHVLNISDFGLSDNLYIKMNARGKPLSDFEKFKASFEKIISKHDEFDYFADSIDGKWQTSFWVYAKGTLEEDCENVKELSKKSDLFLLNFIKKISEYLFYLDQNISNDIFIFEDNTIEKIYSNESNFHLLVKCFDLMALEKLQDWEGYFERIFSKNYTESKVALHQEISNFFFKTITGDSFSRFEDLILFAWVNYVTRANSIEITSDLKDFLRIQRNCINNINQKKKASLDSELRADYYRDIVNFIDNLDTKSSYSSLRAGSSNFLKKYIQYEMDKFHFFGNNNILKELLFKLEDHPQIKGLLFNFDLGNYAENELKNIVKNFYSLFEKVNYKDIIRLLLCFGDYAVTIVSDSKIGKFKFLGAQDKWHRIIASPEGEVRTNLKGLFELFRHHYITDWSTIINSEVDKIRNNYKDSWYWYFLDDEFKVILERSVFTINDSDAKLREIEIFNPEKPSLMAFHYNPFVYYLRYHSDEKVKKALNLEKCCGQYSEFTFLHLNNGVKLEQWDNRWYFTKGFDVKEITDSMKYDDHHEQYYFECEHLINDVIPVITELNDVKINLL
ncbi:DUF262 domain-containing protein [Chryseobacterium sp. H3056]|uniref:DUF262 domain-containing protein n=1 Tax=Kaistella daneshvariae TaxID=2487074 RepID=A0A3N0X0F1_9FLAO|nr:DUF262 domain-containing protein [Kaistella daneshvariae]ROI10780.1 DUF262 domain-containing protein [Kaistella daneshvariae]